jgi:hypothetical protein
LFQCPRGRRKCHSGAPELCEHQERGP